MFGVRSPRRGWLEVAGRRLWWRLPAGGALRPFAQHVAVQSVPQGQLALADEPEPEPVGSVAIADAGVGVGHAERAAVAGCGEGGIGRAAEGQVWTSPLRQDTSLEGRMSTWKTDSEGTGASSPPSSNVTRWSWCAPPVGRSPRSPGSLGSTTPRLATGSSRTASTVANKRA